MADASFEPAPVGRGVAVSGDAGVPRALFMPGSYSECMRVAEIMADGNFVPGHLRGKPGDCLAILMQAMRWGMDPWAVGNKTYFVNDRMAYESQLVVAVVNSSGILDGRLRPTFEGDGEALVCRVTGKIKGEKDAVTIEQPIRTITTRNSPLWKQAPRQQLGYYTQRLWARLHTPEVLLGVYDVDEAEAIEPRGQVLQVAPLRSAKVARVEAKRGTEEAIQTAVGAAQEPATAKVADAVDAIFSEQPEDGDGRLPDEQDGEQVDPETGEVVQSEPEPEPAVEQPKRRGRPPKAQAEPQQEAVVEPEPTPEPAKEESKPEPAKELPKVTSVAEPEMSAATGRPYPTNDEEWATYLTGFETMMKIRNDPAAAKKFTDKHSQMYRRAPKPIQEAMVKAYEDQLEKLANMGQGGSY